jgi:hypothetical protein
MLQRGFVRAWFAWFSTYLFRRSLWWLVGAGGSSAAMAAWIEGCAFQNASRKNPPVSFEHHTGFFAD